MRHGVLTADVARWVDPAVAYRALYSTAQNSFWLDSGPAARTGMSVIGASDAVAFDNQTSPILETLRYSLAEYHVEPGEGFRLGWVGWLGYELRGSTMGEPVGHRGEHPDAAMMFVDRAVTFDHSTSRVTLLALGERWSPELLAWRDATLAELARLGEGAPEPVASEPVDTLGRARPPVRWRYSDDDYLSMIRACQSAIRAGDAYQLCLTSEATVETNPEPLEAYLALRGTSPSHHGGLLRFGELALLSATPEQFLAVDPDGTIETKPIKGTRRRDADPARDAGLRAELLASEKERAENLMIVDLMRNDLSRVCELGTVAVTTLLAVESYPQVHQLVSTVRGKLRAEVGAVDAVAACFPAGSMTGAPKRSATRILERLEARPRGIYSGAFGYFGLDGRVDLAMVIRSIVLDGTRATVGAGGGITALSVAEEELEEVQLKAAALLEVLATVASRPTHGRRSVSL